MIVTQQTNAATLTQGVLAAGSGMTIVGGSEIYTGAAVAAGTVDGLKQAVAGSFTGVDIPAGIVLSTGSVVNLPNSNVATTSDTNNMAAGSAELLKAAQDALGATVATSTSDAAILQFSFTADPAAQSISFNVTFASEEYPTYIDQYVDIATVFVDGKNVALFNSDPARPLSVTSTNVNGGAILNNASVGGTSPIPIVFNGVSIPLTIIASLDPTLSVHTIKIGIADTNDAALDSAVFVGNMAVSSVQASNVFTNFDVAQAQSKYGNLLADVNLWDGTFTAAELAALAAAGISQAAFTDMLNAFNQANFWEDTLGVNNNLKLYGGDDVVYGGAGNDTLNGGAGNDLIDGGAGNDILDGEVGNDTLIGGTGIDWAYYNTAATGVTVSLNLTTAQATGGAGSDTLSGIENLLGSNYNDVLTGDSLANTLVGGTGNDTLDGLAGNDILNGGAGNDTLTGGAGIDWGYYSTATAGVTVNLNSTTVQATGGAGSDTLSGIENLLGSNYNDVLIGDAQANTLNGGAGNDTLNGGTGNDILTGGTGIDWGYYNTAAAGVTVNLNLTAAQATGGAGSDTLSGIENLLGSNYNDVLAGDAQANTLNGGAGNDTLNGGAGNDTLTGGTGIDWGYYNTAAAGVTVNLNLTAAQATGGAGSDTLSGIENLLGSNYNDVLTGDAQANTLNGGAGNDTLNGGAGNDTLTGGTGIDWAYYDNAAAGVTVDLNLTSAQAAGGAGSDTLSGIENLQGSNYNDILTGDSFANTLKGGIGNDALNGGAGNDILSGGAGNDILIGGTGIDWAQYITATAGVTVNLNLTTAQATGGAGSDTLSGIENLEGGGYNDVLTGDAQANTLNGGAGNDILNGGAGNDLLNGGAGVDTASYQGASSGVAVTLLHPGVQQNTVGAGLDTLSGIENLTGSSFDDTLIGNAGANVLGGGGAGNDTMSGGAGNDTYVVSGAGGSVLIEDTVGVDTLDASAASAGGTIDLTPGGSSNIDGRIVTLAAGGSVTIPLDVLFLQDLSSSFNNDLITVRTLVPQVVDAISAFQSDARFGMSSFIDKPTGGFGASTDYVYRTDLAMTNSSASLLATLNSLTVGSGSDGPEAQIEALMQAAVRQGEVGYRADSFRAAVVMTDANFHVAGDFASAPANNGDAVLNGTPAGSGEDYPTIALLRTKLLAAGIVPVFAVTAGNETYYNGLVANLGFGTVVTLAADSSNLVSVLTTGLTQITEARIENAIGSAFNDTLIGNDLVNQLTGGAGNDTYYVQNTGDMVVELAGTGSGVDLVNSSVSYTLSANVENLTLTGSANINATGNELNNTLVGSTGDNVLTGGAGNDRMLGGRGNDTYHVDSSGDRVIEYSGNGVDTVNSSISYTLGANLENLTLTGASAINGVGNALDNTLIGNSAANVLNGRAGADTLTGGLGADTFVFDSLTGIDTITDFVVVDDTIRLENAVFTSLTATGTLAAGNLNAGGGFTTAADANDYLIYDSTTGALYYDADGNGAGAAVQFATLGAATHPALTAADIVVI